MSAISYVVGDATAPLGDGKKIIVYCCNNEGAWGAGFVLALSRRWIQPEACYLEWAHQCGRRKLPLGDVQLVDVSGDIAVANIIGQILSYNHKAPPIRYEALASGLKRVAGFALARGATVHAPRLGCGLAGGSWERVSAILEMELCARGIAVTIYDLAA